ncbi:MAG TPA: hypothetical protein PLQ41_06675 [bacterium]|nr:hypothetical protein [bacterium]
MEFKEDFEELKPYYEAFWNCEVLDRIAVMVTAPKKKNLENQWGIPRFVATQPSEVIIDSFERYAKDVFFGGLAVPYFWPNFGPDVFSAFLGAELHYSEKSDITSWADWKNPVLSDYNNLELLTISDDNPVYKKYISILKLAVEKGKGRYLVGITDIHAGFDSLCVLRGGPDRGCMDLIEYPEDVKKAMKVLFKAWKKVYDDYWSIVKDAQKGSTTWISIWAPGKMFPVQNDLSCLVSPAFYREFFLEELLWEIEYLDYSIYHLDGVEALQHLDILLDIPKLNAIQWVSGAKFSKESIERWIPLYKRIQAKKKAIVVYPRIEEIDTVLENLRPEGLLIAAGCRNQEEAEAVLKKLGW